ncbi:hypothetical protein DFS34DRAFT_347706 [Phlyctochytrium arcticum]|nr:hypothetical protein DFS34DRAFT_347706 [Phlyctochytrium arcticum]
MKDPRASLADYGVRTGSKIMMIGDNSPIPQRPAHSHQPQHQRDHRDHVPQRNHENLHRPAPASNHQQSRYSPSSPSPSSPHHSNSPTPQPQLSEEEQLVEKLNTHLEYARNTVLPVVDDYVNQVKAFIAAKPESSSENSGQPKPLRDLYAKCSELLLQCLLKIDSVICPPELEGARTTRKEAVRFVQSKLDEIDSLKEKANASL